MAANFQTSNKPLAASVPEVEGVESSRQECPITGTLGATSNCPMRHIWNWFRKSE